MTSNIIGQGAQAVVYEENGYAIKAYPAAKHKVAIFYELLINALIENTGLPSPRIVAVDYSGQQCRITMTLLKGQALSRELAKENADVAGLMEKFVRLQIAIHHTRLDQPANQQAIFVTKIRGNPSLSAAEQALLIDDILRLGQGSALCHGDFHPDNVMVENGELAVLDWADASIGCAKADACRSYLILLLHARPLAQIYLDLYCQKSGATPAQVLDWLPIVSALRLAENKADESAALLAQVRQRTAGA